MGLSKEQSKVSAHQLFSEAEAIKAHLLDPSTLSTSKETLQTRRKLGQVLERLLLTDLDYALDKKVEQDLWSIVFRSPITELQSKSKDQKNSSQTQQGQLALTLEAASGFYLQLLQKLSHIHNVDSFYYPRGSAFSQSSDYIKKDKTANKSSVVYICQHCMVHLGDIARYRGQSLQAETFYRHAIELIPSNGQPYNQLAILEAASGEKLSTVFFYIRSLAVLHPFPLAATNLQKLYLKLISDNSPLDPKSRMSAYEYISTFLQFQALVHVGNDFPKAEKVLSHLTTSLPALIIAEKLETWQLLQMATVCMFTIGHAWSSLEGEDEKNDHAEKENVKSRMSTDEIQTVNIGLDLIASMLSAFLLPIHAVLDVNESRDYFTLPAVKIVLDWTLRHHKLYGILTEESFIKKPQIWHGLCKLLNDLSSEENLTNEVQDLEFVPLPEDWDLQCFLPLQSSQTNLKFQNQNQKTLSDSEACKLRAQRLIKIGKQLSEIKIFGNHLFSIIETEEGLKKYKATQSIVATDQMLLQQIQELAISNNNANNSAAMMPKSSSSENAETPTKMPENVAVPIFQEVRFKLDEQDHNIKKKELIFKESQSPPPLELNDYDDKRSPPPPMGNIKMENMSQGNREQRKGGRQNVALQAILQQRASGQTSSNYNRSTKESSSNNRMPENENPNNWMPTYNPMQNVSPQMNQMAAAAEMKARYNGPNSMGNPNQFPMPNMDLPFNQMPPPNQYGVQQPSMGSLQQQQQALSPRNQVPIQPNKTSPNMPPYMNNVPQNRLLWNYNMNFSGPPPSNQQNQNPSAVHSLMMQQQQQQMLQAQQPPPPNSSQSLMQAGFHMMPPPPPQREQSKLHEPLLHGLLGNSINESLQQNQFNNPMMHRRDTLDIQPPQSSYGLQIGNRMGIQNVDESQRGHFGTMNQTYGSSTNRLNQGSSVNNQPTVDLSANTYSLFSSPWSSGLTTRNKDSQNSGMEPHLMQHRTQSLWSGPGPSPLERLLEQQKQRRDASSHGN